MTHVGLSVPPSSRSRYLPAAPERPSLHARLKQIKLQKAAHIVRVRARARSCGFAERQTLDRSMQVYRCVVVNTTSKTRRMFDQRSYEVILQTSICRIGNGPATGGS